MGIKCAEMKSMSFLWRVNRGHWPGNNRAIQGGEMSWIFGIELENCICIFLWGPETPLQRTGGIPVPFGLLYPKYCKPSNIRPPPMPERTEKTDALLLTNRIYLRAWIQCYCYHIAAGKPFSLIKNVHVCFLVSTSWLITWCVTLLVLINVRLGMRTKVRSVQICQFGFFSYLYVSRWTIELQSEELQLQMQQKRCPPQSECPRHIWCLQEEVKNIYVK